MKWLTLVYTEILIWLLPTLLAPRDSYSSASPRFFVFYFSISARLLFLVNLGPHLDHRGNMLSNNFLVSCLKLLQSQVSNEIVTTLYFVQLKHLRSVMLAINIYLLLKKLFSLICLKFMAKFCDSKGIQYFNIQYEKPQYYYKL